MIRWLQERLCHLGAALVAQSSLHYQGQVELQDFSTCLSTSSRKV